MTTLKPQIPFIWPDPQVFEEPAIYEHNPPYGNLMLGATWAFGVLPAVTVRGVRVLNEWLKANPDLKLSVIMVVYPACSTRQCDLADLRGLALRYPDRLYARVLPLEEVTDRSINALCFSAKESDSVHMVIGPSEDLGLEPWRHGHRNFAFLANPSLVEAFRCHFDWLWGKSCDVQGPGTTDIPELVLPPGSQGAARSWQSYMNELHCNLVVDDESYSDAQCASESVEAIPTTSPEVASKNSPTERLGVPTLDKLTEFVAGLYGKGSLVTNSKRSKIPPLDAPLDPGLFGDASETRRGRVSRKVIMRISVIDEEMLKAINKRKDSIREVLNKLSFALADGTRWMPFAARPIFEAELKRINDEGHKLISDLFSGDVDSFLATNRKQLVADLNKMHTDLGRPGTVKPEVVEKVFQSLHDRLTKAKMNNFIPEISYSEVGFRATANDFASPWGQAFSLLADIAAYPRKALTDGFFYRGVTTSRQGIKAIRNAMNVADDALLRDAAASELEDRCELELDLISRIGEAPVESKQRCSLVWKIIQGDSTSSIEEELEELKKVTA